MNEILTNAYNTHFPLVSVRYNKYKHQKSPWITNGLLKSIKFRDKLYRKLRRTSQTCNRHSVLTAQLRNYNNILRRSIKLAKKTHYSHLFSAHKNDIRNTWKHINQLLNRTNNSKSSKSFNISNQPVTDLRTIANEFNTYFANIGTNIASNIQSTGSSA